jgi:hypothetical protein
MVAASPACYFPLKYYPAAKVTFRLCEISAQKQKLALRKRKYFSSQRGERKTHTCFSCNSILMNFLSLPKTCAQVIYIPARHNKWLHIIYKSQRRGISFAPVWNAKNARAQPTNCLIAFFFVKFRDTCSANAGLCAEK